MSNITFYNEIDNLLFLYKSYDTIVDGITQYLFLKNLISSSLKREVLRFKVVMLVEVITMQKFVFTLIESTLISTVYTLFFCKNAERKLKRNNLWKIKKTLF